LNPGSVTEGNGAFNTMTLLCAYTGHRDVGFNNWGLKTPRSLLLFPVQSFHTTNRPETFSCVQYIIIFTFKISENTATGLLAVSTKNSGGLAVKIQKALA